MDKIQTSQAMRIGDFGTYSSIPILACPPSANTQFNACLSSLWMIKPRCHAFQQDDCENEFIYDDSVRDKVQKNERSVDEVKVLSVKEASRGMQLSG